MNSDQNIHRVKTSVQLSTDSRGNEYYIEYLEVTLHVSEIHASETYKAGCEPCMKYGKNLACPPYSPVFSEYVKGCGTARIICKRVPLEHFHGTTMEERYMTAYLMVRGLLNDTLLRYRGEGYIVAGSGACLACERCVLETGDTTCIRPVRRIYSLESLGVNVVSLAAHAFFFPLEWSGSQTAAGFVSAVGACFKRGNVAA